MMKYMKDQMRQSRVKQRLCDNLIGGDFFYRHGLDDDKTQAGVVHLDLVLAGFGCFWLFFDHGIFEKWGIGCL